MISPDIWIQAVNRYIDHHKPEDDREPLDYISIKFDSPEMAQPFNAVLFEREDGTDLVWSRAKAKQ